MVSAPAVGTLGEKHLHAALKRWCAEPGDAVEVPVDGYVVDLVRDGTLIEVQTRGFSSMRRKLSELVAAHDVRLVHPVAVEKWIVKLDEHGEPTSRRKSPRRGVPHDVFAELVSFPELVADDRFSLEILLTQQEELRRFDERRARRRRGWVVVERRLIDVVGRVAIDSAADLAALLPSGLPDPFATADLAEALGRTRRLAQQMAYCLRRTGVIEPAGKVGNAVQYTIGDPTGGRSLQRRAR